MATPVQNDSDVATGYAALDFTIRSILNRTATAELVKVEACTNTGGVTPYGFVDVVPLVNQIAGDGSSVPRGVIYRLPYQRVQGGHNAIIIDPVPKDIGLAVFAMRDTSAVKANPVQAVTLATGTDGTPPGSARVYDPADGMYFGGFLNPAATQYLLFAAGILAGTPNFSTTQNLTAGTGADGTFTTPTGQTVTVQGGIVVNIS